MRIPSHTGMRLMRHLILPVLAGVLAFGFSGTENLRNVYPEPEAHHPRVAKKLASILPRLHYNHQELSDSLSSIIYEGYVIESLDPNKANFLASDLQEFEEFRYLMDDFLLRGNLEPAYYIFSIFKKRYNNRIDYALSCLNKGFDFSKKEVYEFDRENKSWARSTTELDEYWRQRVKNDALNLKLAGKEWDDIVETLTKRYENQRRVVNQYDGEDVFQLYMNAFTEAFDPHTNYLSPFDSEGFKIRMQLSLEGIGAQLTRDSEYTKVVRIIPGGPADRSGQLKAEDRIIGVGQGEDGEVVDVVGWKLDDVVDKIRGKKGTVVRLEILPADESHLGTTKIISLVRDKVKLEDAAAKSDTLHLRHQGKEYVFGIIELQSFYADIQAQSRGDRNYRSCSRDVRKLLKKLQSQDVDGVIIDLRNNGGGSLSEAIKLSGLFIRKGPVVQVRNSTGYIEVNNDPDPDVAYDGPLAVLVNRYSASASEIFAAAIQDYQRGVIIGSQTYGKGTVQHLLPIERFLRNETAKLGQVKLTIAKFYRINGGSTQHTGVIPDIPFPSRYSIEHVGESARKNALPWDQIAPVSYSAYGNLKKAIPQLLQQSKLRQAENIEFKFLRDDYQESQKMRARTFISLNEAERKSERDRAEKKRFMRENERRKHHGLPPLKEGEDIPKDEDRQDPMLLESAYILVDLLAFSDEGLTGYFR